MPDLLSYDERTSALRELLQNRESLRKLLRYAQLQSYKTEHEGKDLINEAIVRILDGQRRTWPRDISALSYVIGVVRSISDEWWNKKRQEEQFHTLLPENGEYDSQFGSEPPVVEAYEDFMSVMNDLAPNPAAQKIFLGMYEGVNGEELRTKCGLTKTEYETARRWILRRLNPLGRVDHDS